MKVISDVRPEKLEFENKVDGMIDVIINTNIEEIEVFDEERNKKINYEYDTYRTKKAFTMDLDKEILKNFNQYVEEFEGIEYEKAAAEVRAKRNELLAQTDKDMAFDRLGINIEDFDIPSLTLTNIITFVKTLAQAVKALGGIFKNILNSKMAKYRQDLRDITEQPGFPFNVEWPVLEKDNNDNEE